MPARLNRTTNLVIAVALGLVGWFWYLFGLLMWWGNGLGKDSANNAFFDASFIVFLIFWATVSLAIVWGVLRFLKRAFKPPPRHPTHLISQPVRPAATQEQSSPDEILSRLVKKL